MANTSKTDLILAEQLKAFVEWERKQNPFKRHIAEWALRRIKQLEDELARLRGRSRET